MEKTELTPEQKKQAVSEYMADLGRKSGQKLMATRGREYYQKIGKKGLEKRWNK